MWAADSGKCDVVTELISLGADVDIQDNVSHSLMSYDTGKWLRTTKCTVCYYTKVSLCSPEPRSACINCFYTAVTKYFTYGIVSLWDIQLTFNKVSSLGKISL